MNPLNQTAPIFDRYRRVPWVCDITTLSRTTIWRLEKENKFPKKRKIGNNSVGWRESEILAWISERPTVSGGSYKMESITATPQRKAAINNQPNQNRKNQKPIDNELLKRVDNALSDLTKIRRKLLLHLFSGNPNTTKAICHIYSIENLGGMVFKMNPLLKKHGLVINIYPPASPLIISFLEKTSDHFLELATLDVKKIQ